MQIRKVPLYQGPVVPIHYNPSAHLSNLTPLITICLLLSSISDLHTVLFSSIWVVESPLYALF